MASIDKKYVRYFLCRWKILWYYCKCTSLFVESGVKHHNLNPRLDWRYNWNIVESGIKYHNPNHFLDWSCVLFWTQFNFFVLVYYRRTFLRIEQVTQMLRQTPDSFQLRSAQYSPLYPAVEPCSVADTKSVRSLMLCLTLDVRYVSL